MPILDGYDTCKALKKLMKQGSINPLHIVAVTADATPSNIKRCKKAGFTKIVCKPLTPEKIQPVLDNTAIRLT